MRHDRKLLALWLTTAMVLSVAAPFMGLAGAETLAAGNAGTPAKSVVVLDDPVISPSTDSGVAVGHDFASPSYPAPGDIEVRLVTVTFGPDGRKTTTLDTVSELSTAKGTTGLTIPANTVVENDTSIEVRFYDTSGGSTTELTYPGSDFQVVAYAATLVRNVGSSPSVDMTDVSTTGQSTRDIRVGYNAEDELSGGDSLSVVAERKSDGTDLDTATGLESDPKGAATLTLPKTDSSFTAVYKLQRNGKTIATHEADVTLLPYVSSTNVEQVGGTSVDTNNVDVKARAFGQRFVSLRLEDSNTKGLDGRDLGNMGADETTELWVNLTVENYAPDVLMGAAEVQAWQVTDNGDGSADVALRLRPTGTERNYSAWQNGVFRPGDWGTAYDQSDRGMDAVVDLGIGDVPGQLGSDLDGARLNTDAQAFTPPKLKNDTLQFDVAAPHCKESAGSNTCSGDAVNDDGFYEALLPSDFIENTWDADVSPSELTGEYTSEGTTTELDLSVSKLDDGSLLVSASNIHYSEGTINLSVESGGSDDSGSGSSDDGDRYLEPVVVSSDGGHVDVSVREPSAGMDIDFPTAGRSDTVIPTRLSFDADADDGFRLTVSSSTSVPEGTPAPSATDVGGEAVGYLRVDHSVSDDRLSNVTVRFTVGWNALVNGTNERALVLYRHHDGEWQALETRVVDYTTHGAVLEAQTPGLSVFAVGSAKEPALSVTDAALGATSVGAGEPVTVSTTVANDGTAEGTTTVRLAADGTVRDSATVSLVPGESTTVDLTATFDAPGTYDLAVGETGVGSVTVESATTATPTPTPAATATPASTATAAPTSTPAPTATAAPTSTPTPAPTAADGPGFGPLLALLAVVVAALARLRAQR